VHPWGQSRIPEIQHAPMRKKAINLADVSAGLAKDGQMFPNHEVSTEGASGEKLCNIESLHLSQ
jgi:hypothetical protein